MIRSYANDKNEKALQDFFEGNRTPHRMFIFKPGFALKLRNRLTTLENLKDIETIKRIKGLHSHKLQAKWQGYWSIWVDERTRLWFWSDEVTCNVDDLNFGDYHDDACYVWFGSFYEAS